VGITDEAIEVKYWQQPDRTWVATCVLTQSGVGVTVGGTTQDRVFDHAATAMDRLWTYLGRQSDLPDQLRLLLRFHRHPLRFRRISAPNPAAVSGQA
jgi:hypothetical protein